MQTPVDYSPVLLTVIPLVLTAIVTIVGTIVATDFRKQIYDLKLRITVLETTLTDNHIPLPTASNASR